MEPSTPSDLCGVTPSEKELFGATEAKLFKSDRRSRVWLVHCRGRGWVIKRYGYSRVRQVLSLLMGIHPVQAECRRARQLARDGLPVVPIVGSGVRRGRAWLVTAKTGESLQRAIAAGVLSDRATADGVIKNVVGLVTQLIRTEWYYRDLQAANVVVDHCQRVWMIDTGSSRRSRSRRHTVHMLAMLGRSARIEGASRADTLRGLRDIVERLPWLGPVRRLVAEVLRDPGAYDSHGRGL